MNRFKHLATISLLSIMATAAPAVGRDGETVYKAECAGCHDSGATRMPAFEMLAALEPGRIVAALQTGAMRVVGNFNLDGPERLAVAEFITGKPVDPDWMGTATTNMCLKQRWPAGDPFAVPHWNGWGGNLGNTRFQTRAGAGLSASDVPDLELKWAFAFPGETFVESQPTVVGGRIFVGSPSGTIYALDARTGCTHWTFQARAPVKAPVTIAPVEGGYAAFFGDQAGRVYALDAADGSLRWDDVGDDHPSARITGGTQVFEGRLYVPMASLEEALAMDPGYECCVFRGSVIAYDAQTGKRLWKRYTISKVPAREGKQTDGGLQYGPSGAAVWSAVTIDSSRRRIYIGTGDNYSNPPSDTSDSIVALDLDSGEIVWKYQGLSGDAWNIGCMSEPKINCPEGEGPDEDMGASPILATLADGRSVLIGAQKTGVAHALDPQADGRVLWRKKLAKGGVQGGLQWGQATDGQTLYASRSDVDWLSEGVVVADVELNPNAGGGLLAVDLDSGEILWEAPPVSCTGRPRCSPAQSAAVSAMPGVVFSGSQSGEMRAFDASNGTEIWRYDTVRDFDTVNGARGRGGSIDQGGAVIVDGMVYFNSGYAKWGANPGNVLLGFGLPDD